MSSTLERATISRKQIVAMSHPLAAINHRQWITWQEFVIPYLDNLPPDSVTAFVHNFMTAGLKAILTQDAENVIGTIKQVVGDFALPVDKSAVMRHKRAQFTKWLSYAVGQESEHRQRWLAQCRTAFLDLPSRMQKSDYHQAHNDIVIVAEVGGLILPDPLAPLVPMTDRRRGLARLRHRLGQHGQYLVCEQPWSNICAGCHVEFPGV